MEDQLVDSQKHITYLEGVIQKQPYPSSEGPDLSAENKRLQSELTRYIQYNQELETQRKSVQIEMKEI